MRIRRVLFICFLPLLVGAMLVAGQGYDEMPVDAKILPLGVRGMGWGDLEPGVRGGTFYLSAPGNPNRWNPMTATETSTTLYTNHIYHGMVYLNPVTGVIDPLLAKSWEISEEGRTIAFHLRRGLRWSDGEPFTAADVLFTFRDVILNEEITTVARDGLRLPDGTLPIIEKTDDYTVRVTTSSPFRPILSAMGQKILPKHKLEHLVHKLNPDVEPGTFDTALGLDMHLADIVGMGPYVPASFAPDQQVVFERNPYYYVYDAEGIQLPYFDRRVVLIVSSDDVTLLKFLNGEIDGYAPRTSDLPFLMGKAALRDFTVKLDPAVATYGSSWIAFNQDIGLADGTDENKRTLYRARTFRQAFAHLLDKEAMIESIFHGLALPQWSPLSFGSPFYAGRESYGGTLNETDAVVFEYDLDEASRLLDSIGVIDRDNDGWRDYEDGTRVVISLSTVSGLSDFEGMAVIISDRARLVGLDVRLAPGEANAVLTAMFTGSFDALILAFTGGNEPHSLGSLYTECGRLHFWRQSACDEPTEVDIAFSELFGEGVATLDAEEAFEIYAEIQRLAAEDAALIYTAYAAFRYAFYDYVGNAEMANPNGHATGHSGNACDFVFDRRLLP